MFLYVNVCTKILQFVNVHKYVCIRIYVYTYVYIYVPEFMTEWMEAMVPQALPSASCCLWDINNNNNTKKQKCRRRCPAPFVVCVNMCM
jgi:hypothetical protein